MRHHPGYAVALTYTGTTIGRQFGWGATPSKRYQGCPKVDSCGSETRSGVSKAKVGLTRSCTTSDRETKVGFNEPICPVGVGY